jgi:mono/diheme cytochrome c family protein
VLRLVAALALLPAAACTQQMANQPSYYPLKPSEFFPDGRSARPLVPGTIARGRLRDNDLFFTGRTAPLPHAAAGAAQGMIAVDVADWQKWSAEFPFEPTREDIQRGKQRFGIYCSMCHGATGHGYGKIPERGFTRPPSYHVEKTADGQVDKDRSLSRGYRHRGIEMNLRDAPVGYYYDVITNGYGAMGHYREQVPPADRWKIIAYIRALQYAEAPEADRAAILKGGNK